MTAASKIRKLLETHTFQVWGDYTSKMIIESFEKALATHGYKGIVADAAFTMSDGIFVRLTDEKGYDVKLQFTTSEDDVPMVYAIPEDEEDDFIDIDLSDLDPPMAVDFMLPDIFDLSWMNKTTLATLLDAGKVTSSEGVVAQYRTLGSKPLVKDTGHFKRLPKVVRRDARQDSDIEALRVVKRLGWRRKNKGK